MASFKRHQQHKDVTYDEGCGCIAWDCWGGTSGINWEIKKLEQIDKKKESKIKEEFESLFNQFLNKIKNGNRNREGN